MSDTMRQALEKLGVIVQSETEMNIESIDVVAYRDRQDVGH